MLLVECMVTIKNPVLWRPSVISSRQNISINMHWGIIKTSAALGHFHSCKYMANLNPNSYILIHIYVHTANNYLEKYNCYSHINTYTTNMTLHHKSGHKQDVKLKD